MNREMAGNAGMRGRYTGPLRKDTQPDEPVYDWRPTCWRCTWVWAGGRFKLKFVHRMCAEHVRLLSPDMRVPPDDRNAA